MQGGSHLLSRITLRFRADVPALGWVSSPQYPQNGLPPTGDSPPLEHKFIFNSPGSTHAPGSLPLRRTLQRSDCEAPCRIAVDHIVNCALLSLHIQFNALKVLRLLSQIILPYVLCDLNQLLRGIFLA